jgi:outer membrane usher protein
MAAAAAGSAEGQAWLLDVTVNGRVLPGVWLVHEADGALSVGGDLLAAAGISLPPGHPDGAGLPLSTLAVGRPRFDREQLQLAFDVAPERLAAQRIDLADDFVAGPPPRGLSAIASYDIGMSRASDAETIAGAALDVAVASGRTTCSAGVLVRNEGDRTRRALTNCLVDFPERMVSVGLGDGISGDSALSPPVRFGGVRVGTDFALNPYFNTRPLIGVQGTARLPSTLELWLDQQLALRTELPPGPFDVSDLPAHTGNGELRAVITDALGRQSVIAAPVFVDPRLLRQGLLDWTAEAGRVRLDFLGEDDRYGERFARFAARRGITSRLTVGAQAEVREDGGLVGAQAAVQVGERGMAEVALAASRHDGNDGHAWLLGYSFRGQRWNANIRHWQGEAGFASLAYPEAGDAPSRFTQASIGVRVGASTSVSLAVFDRRQADQPDQQLANLALTMQPWRWSQVIVSASHSFGDEGDTRLGVFLSVPLGHGHTGTASVRHRDEGTRVAAAVQSPYPVGTGFGYRAEVAHEDGNASVAGDALYRGRAFQAMAAGRHDSHGNQVQAGIAGSVVMAAGGVHLTRNEPGSYAVVQLPHAGVRVLRDHQTVAVTDADGVALIPGLRPFERNRVELAAADLPLTALADVLALELVPGRRQAIGAGFDVQQLRYVAGHVRLADGSRPPAGALIEGEGLHGGSVVGFEGEVFLPLKASADAQQVVLRWPLAACALTVPALPPGTDVVNLEELSCQPTD